MRTRLRDRLAAEDGFTLPELVITVAILGLIVVPLTGVVLGFLRNTADTQARMSESHDVQFAAAYWQRDVASIGVRSNTYNDDPAVHSFPLEQSVGLGACALPAGASAVVTLAWSEFSGATPATIKVTYATRARGAAYELLRVRCGGSDSTVSLASNLTAVPTVTCEGSGGGTIPCTGGGSSVPAVIKLGLSVHDASGRSLSSYDATLTGERRQS